jgi:hypothetical protein
MKQAGVITNQDYKCVKCSYSLYSLRRLGRCPECGTPVIRPIRRARSRSPASESYLTIALCGSFFSLLFAAGFLFVVTQPSWHTPLAIMFGFVPGLCFSLGAMKSSRLALHGKAYKRRLATIVFWGNAGVAVFILLCFLPCLFFNYNTENAST